MATSAPQKEESKPKEDIVYKYSNRGSGQLKEAALIEEGKPYFIKYNEEKGFITVEPKITDITPPLRPPVREEYPYQPYEFKTLTEPQEYLLRALEETPDTLYAKTKAFVKLFNDVNEKTVNLLSSYIFSSYFQDRFSTVHYINVVGANGTGKSAFGDTFECLGYRVVNVTNTSEAFWFRIFGTVEYGQVTIVVEEFDKMDENSQIMAMLKVGYQPNARVPRMNNDNSKMEFFYPFGLKIMIAERSPNEDRARGVLDRSFKTKSYKGTPAFNIKEIRNPQGNARRQALLDKLQDLRKLFLMYRLVHIKDPYKEVFVGLDGRDEELCKPELQLYYTLGASEELLTEIEETLQYFLDSKNNRKGDSLEGAIYPIVVDVVDKQGKDYVTIDNDNAKRKSVSSTDVWNSIIGSFDGKPDDKNPSIWYSDDFGKRYRNTVTKMICDKFGAEIDHKEKGNHLVFDLERLAKTKRIYENDGKIKTRPFDESGENDHENDKTDSLTHHDHASEQECSESGYSNKTDSISPLDARGGHDESVNQVECKNPDSPNDSTKTNRVKCPHCDFEDIGYEVRIHRKCAHGEGI
jgi:hypothetical protein